MALRPPVARLSSPRDNFFKLESPANAVCGGFSHARHGGKAYCAAAALGVVRHLCFYPRDGGGLLCTKTPICIIFIYYTNRSVFILQFTRLVPPQFRPLFFRAAEARPLSCWPSRRIAGSRCGVEYFTSRRRGSAAPTLPASALQRGAGKTGTARCRRRMPASRRAAASAWCRHRRTPSEYQ